MSSSKTILVLYSGEDEPVTVTQLAEAIVRNGSTAVVRRLCSGQYGNVLDAVANADTVIYWPE